MPAGTMFGAPFAFRVSKPIEAVEAEPGWRGGNTAMAKSAAYCTGNGICFCSVRYNSSYIECKVYGCGASSGKKCDWY
jgi:hypothetical protein